MSEQILSNLGFISKLKFSPLDASVLKVLKEQTSDLATWFALAERMAPVVEIIRRGMKLPVRRIKSNIKTLTTEKHVSRWTRLNDLHLESSLFCMIALRGLSALSSVEYDCLLANVNQYIATQQIPLDWVYAEGIKKLLGDIPPTPTTSSFLESYHSGYFRNIVPSESPSKRRRTGNINTDVERHHDEIFMPQDQRGLKPEPEQDSSANYSAEMKHMFSNAPASSISQLPEPFKTAVQNSRQWRLERDQNLETTSCLASLFPRGVTQDVSFTIWCGHDEGYLLNSFFRMTIETPSHSVK